MNHLENNQMSYLLFLISIFPFLVLIKAFNFVIEENISEEW